MLENDRTVSSRHRISGNICGILMLITAYLLTRKFGGLAVVFISKNAKLSIAPIILMLVLFIFVPALNAGTVGIMVPVGVLFTVGVARILYKRGKL